NAARVLGHGERVWRMNWPEWASEERGFSMSEWCHTMFIYATDSVMIYEAICCLAGLDKYYPVDPTTEKLAEHASKMQYGKSTDCAVWGIAWIPTLKEWSILKSCPFSLLALPAGNLLRPRLGTLCTLLE